MRLFIAVNFNMEVKKQLAEVIEKLKRGTVKGNYTHVENLHITVAFIGETDRVQELKQCMDQVHEKNFEIMLKGLGAFKRGAQSLCWLGMDKSPELISINNQLRASLEAFEFPVESREFKPHLTLAREAVLKEGWSLQELSGQLQPIIVEVDGISLMRSERVNGRLKYSEIYYKELKK